MPPSSAAPVPLRPVADGDIGRLVDLNNAAYPAVPVLDGDEMRALLGISGLALAAVDGAAVVGFLLAVDPGADYASENYAYFSSRAVESLYIDRVVVGAEARGRGVGRALYEATFAKAAADGRAEVTCEVNLQPPNPESLAFHERMGFRRLGEQATKGGSITVALLAAPVPAR
ncbi:MAG: family N-acetyltransferase [Naasia sp.]|nr:family N-acetyltransferase [Naasia sp.]